jgi:hypothetical protein
MRSTLHQSGLELDSRARVDIAGDGQQSLIVSQPAKVELSDRFYECRSAPWGPACDPVLSLAFPVTSRSNNPDKRPPTG